MAYIRTSKRENPFVMVDKFGVNDPRLSWKAKGILVYMLSKDDGWKIRVNDLIKRAKDGRDAVYSALGELEKYGYLSRTQIRSENGKFDEVDYTIYERPMDIDPHTENPYTENPYTEKPYTENPTLNNNDFSNNDFSNNGWMGDDQMSSQSIKNNSDNSSSKIEPENDPKHENNWNLFKEFCKDNEINGSQALDLYKVWCTHYGQAPISVVIAMLRELIHDKIKVKGFKFTEVEYKNLVGIFHYRMKSWKQLAPALEDINKNGGWS